MKDRVFVQGSSWQESVEDAPISCALPNHGGLLNDVTGFRLACDDSVRVIRGGSCNVSPDDARAGFRFRYLPSDRYYSLGLRLVRKREGT